MDACDSKLDISVGDDNVNNELYWFCDEMLNVSKSKLGKLGSPHLQQIHEHELFAKALYTVHH